MKKTFLRVFIACLLVLTVVLAIVRPPQSYHPLIEIDAIDVKNPAGTLSLRFLFDGRATLRECEGLTGNLARVALKGCSQCRVKTLSCETDLSGSDSQLFASNPLAIPSGRMANGVVTYHADNAEFALAACQASQVQSLKTASPVICHPANTPRTAPAGHPSISLWSGALLLLAFAAAWLTGWLIIRYEHLHAHFSHDHLDGQPQKYHTEPTPRIGGLTILAGLLAAGGVMLLADPISIERTFGLLLLAAMPAFLGGLVEDITKKVGVLERLLLTMLAGALAAWLLGAVVHRLDIQSIDLALTWLPLAVVFTTFAVGGIANAINIIDGYNGLAGGFAVIVLAAMAFVANSVGDTMVLNTALALSGAILGFLVWNWPGGKIFLGDGGAYLVGFILAELSILLVVRNPEVSPWFPVLLLIYPIFETFYSIYRRKVQNKLSPGQPDNHHLHQLIHDKLISHQTHGKRLSRNSRVAKYLWLPVGLLAILGAVFSAETPILVVGSIGFCVAYVGIYRRTSAMDIPIPNPEQISSAR